MRRAEPILLHCPACGAALKPCQIVSLGPLDKARSEVMDAPYCRYDCQERECRYGEIQTHMLREGP